MRSFPCCFGKKLIGLTLVQKILRWRHTGFNVHSKVRATSKREAERIKGKVLYQYSRHGSQEESMDYLEFIGRLRLIMSNRNS